MTQDIFLANLFFSYFFDMGDYLAIFTGLALAGALLFGFIKYFIRHA